MDKEAYLEQIKQEAFADEMQVIEKEAEGKLPTPATQRRAIAGIAKPTAKTKRFATVAKIPLGKS